MIFSPAHQEGICQQMFPPQTENMQMPREAVQYLFSSTRTLLFSLKYLPCDPIFGNN